MNESSWFAVQILSAGCAGIFSTMAATLLFLDNAVEDCTKERIRAKAKVILSKIEQSPLSSLPDHVLACGTAFENCRTKLMREIADGSTWLIWPVGAAAGVLCGWLVRQRYGAIGATLMLVGFLSWPVWKLLKLERLSMILKDTSGVLISTFGFALALRTAISLAETPFGVLIALGIAPTGIVLANFVLSFGNETNFEFVPERVQNAVYNTGAIIGMSAFVTVAALSVGRLADPLSRQPHLGLQAVIANLGCDTVSVLLCGAILSTTIFSGRRLSVPALVVSCLVCSLALAWLSLYLAFVGTSDALSAREVSRVLIALSPKTNQFELGAYFFLMHTTFLPTLMLMMLLAFAGAIKATTRWIEVLFRVAGKQHINPIKAGAAALGIFVAVFAAMTGIAGILKAHAHDSRDKGRAAHNILSTQPTSRAALLPTRARSLDCEFRHLVLSRRPWLAGDRQHPFNIGWSRCASLSKRIRNAMPRLSFAESLSLLHRTATYRDSEEPPTVAWALPDMIAMRKDRRAFGHRRVYRFVLAPRGASRFDRAANSVTFGKPPTPVARPGREFIMLVGSVRDFCHVCTI